MPASMAQLFVHYVWGTYQRTPWLIGEVRDLVFRTIAAKCREQHAQVMALNGVEDHVHLLVKLSPTIAVATFISKVKGTSSYAVTHHWPAESFQWQEGYGSFTVSPSGVPVVRHYIANQQAHHAFCRTILDSEIPPVLLNAPHEP